MPNHSTRTRKSLNLLRIPALMSAIALVVFAADQCKTYKLNIPDPATLNLKDGENVIAAVETDHGKFEARVIVKDKVVSEPRLFIGGKLLEETPESRVPNSIRDCLQKDQAAVPSGNRLANAARPALDWIAPTTYGSKGCRIVFATASCVAADVNGKHFFCASRACCSNGVCAYVTRIY